MPARAENWSERIEAIRQILEQEEIRSQAELGARLEARGYRVTQSSISRDLHELHVVKVEGRYQLGVAPSGPAEQALAEAAVFLRRVTAAGPNLLVVRTPPGTASMMAVGIDGAGWPEVAGTLAGDDTVFVATTDAGAQARVVARLEILAGLGKE